MAIKRAKRTAKTGHGTELADAALALGRLVELEKRLRESTSKAVELHVELERLLASKAAT